jgi:hypothetical protein
VPADDLNSIPGLEGKHARALARQEVIDVQSFAGAGQRDIYRALANIRPRPSLELISRWQAEARNRLQDPARGAMDDAADTDATGWHTVASFAVIFEQCQAGATWERRIGLESPGPRRAPGFRPGRIRPRGDPGRPA